LKEKSINPEPKPRRQVMQEMIKNIGLDVHKNSISIGIADDGRDGEVRYYGKIDNDMNQLDKVLRFVYEAGPCGYGIYRYLTNNNIDCVVIAPSKIPQQSGWLPASFL
jgi:transposase